MNQMMTLDLFVFSLPTLSYQELSRRCEYRHAETERFGQRAALQFLGAGPDTISLPGILHPGQTGDYASFARLRQMAEAGDAYQLMTGYGDILGHYVITSLDTKESVFMDDGAPRKIDFTLELKRYD